jgi:hypothetical protein
MADTKISALSSGGSVAASDELVIARSGANYKIAGTDVATAATSVGTLGSLAVTGNVTLGADVVVSRGAANRLDLASGDSLNVVSGTVKIGGTDVLSSTTLGSGVTGSSLTSVGTLTALTVSGDVTVADKIVHSADTDTAIRFPAADVISFETLGAERCRITDGGHFLVNATTLTIGASTQAFFVYPQGDIRVYRSSDTVAVFSRMTNDGTIISLRQANTEEGTISVAGTTISYNGGHLARWAQSEDGTRIDGLLKGTVLTNLDQMAVWIDPETGEPLANEQLNCMKVSDVEGDPNVAGVFVNYDEREEFSVDMNIAMTGDMIIRIAQGTTVQRGDLLMSAGDGTAKPQGDDIVRAKTIAKVTSTHVTCVYEDGSYCVPCVLMAC